MAWRNSFPVSVTIEPSYDSSYCSYVLSGFRRLIGSQNVRLESLGELSMIDPHPKVMRAVINYGGATRSVAIDLRDTAEVCRGLHEVVDVYAKTNLRPESADQQQYFAIGPTFGIATSRLAQLRAQVRNAGTTANRLTQRSTLRAFRPGLSRADYVFFIAWPWPKHPEVNLDRAAFVNAIRELDGIAFEGGFVPLGRLFGRPAAGLERLSAQRQYRHAAYLRRLKNSAFAVNTPAVHDCLGWKLGEFLALGKAVISLPLTRVMPGHFEHGDEVHVISDPSEAVHAMRKILDDSAYRQHLEKNARAYWEEYLEPSALVRRVIVRAYENEPLGAIGSPIFARV